MKINNFNATNIIKTYANQNQKSKVSKDIGVNNGLSDQFEISTKAKELLELKQQVLDLPEVRSDKVSAIKEQIQKGEYKIAAQELAEKLLDEIYK